MYYYPTCSYCGQRQIREAFDSQEDANEVATLNCSCKDASAYREETKRKKQRDENIKLIMETIEGFKKFCAVRDTELSEQIIATIFAAAVSVLDDFIKAASFAFTKIKANIKKTSKDKVELKFTCTDTTTAEV